ncbi:hypothetical protein P154DRAFT_570549 [Amniculicola lignicola CBS 123094]|uniref:Uncharacterized protein n=1 Tax=Amniculicola lignicola CBS 123094 TaxID=1392246 RepID=A0A6A5WXH4_9PLEO|nr:hypothetical protein P154DRAFT_570549 [Amniculicola lignicola CBS 123094]
MNPSRYPPRPFPNPEYSPPCRVRYGLVSPSGEEVDVRGLPHLCPCWIHNARPGYEWRPVEEQIPTFPAELEATTPFHTPITSPLVTSDHSQTKSDIPRNARRSASRDSSVRRRSSYRYPRSLTSEHIPFANTTQRIIDIRNTLFKLDKHRAETNALDTKLKEQIHRLAQSIAGANATQASSYDAFQKQILAHHSYLSSYLGALDSTADFARLASTVKGQKRCKLGQPQSSAKCPLREKDGDDLRREVCSKHTREGFSNEARWCARFEKGAFKPWECVRRSGEDRERRLEGR